MEGRKFPLFSAHPATAIEVKCSGEKTNFNQLLSLKKTGNHVEKTWSAALGLGQYRHHTLSSTSYLITFSDIYK